MNLTRFLFLILSIYAVSSCGQRRQRADVVIFGGKIYTVNDDQPVVEAVAVSGTRVVFTGKEEEAKEYIDERTKVIDLQGKVMTPGFIEGHGHIMGLGYSELQLDLRAVKSYEELVAMVQSAVKGAKPGEWIVGRGWHQDKWDHLPVNT